MKEIDTLREKIDSIDKSIAELFSERMDTVKKIANYKKDNNFPIYDKSRENSVIEKNLLYVKDEYRPYYAEFQNNALTVSKKYQTKIMSKENVKNVLLKNNSYDIIIGEGIIENLSDYIDIDGKVLVVTDDGVPDEYSQIAAQISDDCEIVSLSAGDENKNIVSYAEIIHTLQERSFSRGDTIIAVGGGMVGDIAGFAAATYMRGINFYNIPTTVLAQVDSSVGGKTAINFDKIKNLVGTFYHPQTVIIDTNLTKTLTKKQFSCGLIEALKMSVTSDESLFDIFENSDPFKSIKDIISKALDIKIKTVTADEKESGQRMILNFGHTVGHAIETVCGISHGESIAIGMLPMCSPEVRKRVANVIHKLGLNTFIDFDVEKIIDKIKHDKKNYNGKIKIVTVDKIGSCSIEDIDLQELKELLVNYVKEEKR